MDCLEQDIGHYNKNLAKLTAFSRAFRLRVIFRSTSCDGYYSPTRRNIVIDPELGQANTIAVFLHELGHVIQHSFGTSLGNNSEKRYFKDKKFKIAYEKEAWDIGELIAKSLGIRLGKWYFEIKEYYIRFHKID